MTVLSTAGRCPEHPDGRHRFANAGRDHASLADLFRCPCGLTRLGNTDERRYRIEVMRGWSELCRTDRCHLCTARNACRHHCHRQERP